MGWVNVQVVFVTERLLSVGLLSGVYCPGPRTHPVTFSCLYFAVYCKYLNDTLQSFSIAHCIGDHIW